jgi:tetratricopeptide (TPR) repeat protein
MWMGAIIIAALILAGVIFGGMYGNRRPAIPPELPEIPTVNLEGADPEIVKVVGVARDAVAKNPQTAGAWGHFAIVLHAHGFSEAAQICYGAAASLEPKNPLWPYLRGSLYHHGPGGPEAALPFFRLAASQRPADSIAQLKVAEALLDLGRLDEAEAEYQKTLAVAKSDPVARLGLAKIAVARRQYKEALEKLDAVSGSPLTQNAACAMLANVHDKLGDHAAAERERKRLAELPEDGLRPDDPLTQVFQTEVGLHVQLTKAERLMAENRVEDVMFLVENAVYRYPDSFEAWAALGNACGMKGDASGAEKAIRRSIQLAPKDPSGWLSLANVLLWQEKPEAALEAVQKALALDPRKGAAYLSLGECRQKLGDLPAAAEAYRTALRYSPGNEQAKERLEKLGPLP